jgi:hypothetical protein
MLLVTFYKTTTTKEDGYFTNIFFHTKLWSLALSVVPILIVQHKV